MNQFSAKNQLSLTDQEQKILGDLLLGLQGK